MNKPKSNNKQTQLKSHSNRSHNQDSQRIYDQLKALVKFLAREAAQQDYNAMRNCSNFHTKEGEEQ